MGSYTEFGGGEFAREKDRGVQGDGCWGNILLSGGHPLDGGCGGKESESLAGEENVELDVDDVDTGTHRFLREKGCSAWEKWIGTGRGILDAMVSTITGMIRAFTSLLKTEPHNKKLTIRVDRLVDNLQGGKNEKTLPDCSL